MTQSGVCDRLRRWWERHDGLDGGIRFLGASAVVVTIETLAGYYLWRGMTEQVRIPMALGWALQFGLTGGSVVGTRAFHRGAAEDKWWGFATSVFAVLCVILDASVAALLINGLLSVNPGLLAVGMLVEVLVVGYLTVHTLMARPRVAPQAATESDRTTATESTGRDGVTWGGPDAVTDPPKRSVTAQATVRATAPASQATPAGRPLVAVPPAKRAARSVEHVPGWTPAMVAAAKQGGWNEKKWLRERAKATGASWNGSMPQGDLRRVVETAELERARRTTSAAGGGGERVPA